MAISPPSDLVLDVVRAADPAEVQEAQAKLKANKAAFAANSLAEVGAGFGAALDIISTPGTKAGLGNPEPSKGVAKMPDEYRQFEAGILQNFVNSMLPSDSEQVYGKGSAGEFWKSMMAEQIADGMSRNGGIGIAEQMFSQALARSEGAVVNAATNESDRDRAMRMVTDFERQVLDLSPTDKGAA
ncbi:rod-binding protein [Neorhizobium sp. T786]|uniref:rod-binding protein n=1 Tax=Pseudorhizobium xiangyangii TaxID=2883104 RepID=UPI001CFFFCAD|nr:rod-binding protein [Neorhizobium xiangyangii]MCB5202675.1 rod-binding protein [Neorhizobium xiangyangii]